VSEGLGSEGLIVNGGEGTIAVVTDELYSSAIQLEQLTRELGALSAEIAAIDRVLSWGELSDAPTDARRAEVDLDRAVMFIAQAELQSKFFSFALSTAADGYSAVEFGARRLLGGVVDGIGGLVGMLAPALVPTALAGATGLVALGHDNRNRLLSNPAVVAGVRTAVMGADDAVMARSGIPAPVARLLGENGLGLAGLPLAAGAVAVLGRGAGALRESEVRVVRESVLPVVGASAPTGFAERLGRVPDPESSGGSQVVIEKYEMPDGEIRAEVYIGGTVDFDPWAEGEPWDMASNISNAIGAGGGSYDAVAAAMVEAGLGPESPVQFTGYSQGGGTAAQLAASGDFDVRGLVTFGGPTGQVPVPESIPTVIVEHRDDLVAALGGRQDNSHAVVVERWATEGADLEGAELLPGHRIAGYQETAALMDDDSGDALTGAGAAIGGFTTGGVLVSRVAYECDRVSSSS
jgi:hypothetical protein